jgi:ribosomal protein S18 acetylase RimI-like enzyme
VQIEIRPATLADAPSLVNLYHDAYTENLALGFPASAATVSQAEVTSWIESDHLYVALHEGQLIGAVRLRLYPEWQTLVLGRLGVASAFKGQGVGSRLLSHAEAAAAAMGWERLRLTTPATHPYLPALYRRRGYQEVGIRPLPGLPYDEVILEKVLR